VTIPDQLRKVFQVADLSPLDLELRDENSKVLGVLVFELPYLDEELLF
jgi:hypothetical protein